MSQSGLNAQARSGVILASRSGPLVPVAASGPTSTPTPGTPTPPVGTQAALPDYTNDGISPYMIGIHKPAGAGSGYNVQYRIGSAAYVLATSFPFTLTMSGATQTFDLFANDADKVQSIIDNESWNSLFL